MLTFSDFVPPCCIYVCICRQYNCIYFRHLKHRWVSPICHKMVCYILFHGPTYGINVLFSLATLAIACTQRLSFWLVRSYSDLITWGPYMRRLWVIIWCIFLFHCGTTSGTNPSSRIGDGQRIGKTEQMEEGRTKENEHMQGDKVCLGQKKFKECGICLFIFHGYFGNTKAVKANFWTFIVVYFFFLHLLQISFLYLCFLSYFLLGDEHRLSG